MKRLAPLAVILMAACSNTEVTVIAGSRFVNGVATPAIEANISQRFGKHGICRASHTSNPLKSGADDISVDTAGCGLTFRPRE